MRERYPFRSNAGERRPAHARRLRRREAAHLGVGEPLALEDADWGAAEPNEQRRDGVLFAERLEQRCNHHPLVVPFVAEAEWWRHSKRLAPQADAWAAAALVD